MVRSFIQHKLCYPSLSQEIIKLGVVSNVPSILFYVVQQEAGHNNLFLQEALVKKYIGFDIDSKKKVASVVENGKEDIYEKIKGGYWIDTKVS